MFQKKIFILSLITLLCLSACDEGMGINVTLKSKDKDTDSSQAVSIDIDGKDVRLNHATSDVNYLNDGRKVMVSSGDSITINPSEANKVNYQIPSEFGGRWVSLIDAPITEIDAMNICKGSYNNNYQERSWIKDIDFAKQQVIDVFNYEDIISNTPVSYRLNSPNKIVGKAKYEVFEMGVDEPVETKIVDFNYEINSGRLYSVENLQTGLKTVEFIKCTN